MLHFFSHFTVIKKSLHDSQKASSLYWKPRLYIDQADLIRGNGHHSSVLLKTDIRVRKGCIISPHLFNLCTDSVILEADIEELMTNIDGKLVYNLRYADDAALSAEEKAA